MEEQNLNAADKAIIAAEDDAAIKKEEERLNLPTTLPACVSSWRTHGNGTLKHKYFFDYYPYYLYKNKATPSIEYTWNLVWGFKCDGWGVSHAQYHWALETVIDLVEETLRSTFGSMTKYLTLVCPPCNKNQGYRDFAKIVCQHLTMIDAYPHIQVAEDGCENNDNNGIQTVSYDEIFFKGKYVVLFKDVYTKGKSLEIERRRMEGFGARVICAMTIAQTTH